MARIKFGAFITSIAGSLGGQTIQKNRFGSSLRTKPVSCVGQSSSQLEQRAIMKTVQDAWNSLSDVQRAAWHSTIEFSSAVSRKDSTLKLTGREIFIRWNILLLSAGYSIIAEPAYSQEYSIDSDFNIYADGLSLLTVFDVDPLSVDKSFLLNASRSGGGSYAPPVSSAKRINAISLGSGGFDLRESYLNSHAVLPMVNDSISGSIHQFSTVSTIDSPVKKWKKNILPLSDLNPGLNWSSVTSLGSSLAVLDIIYIPDNIILACTRTPGKIFRSTTNGFSFSEVYSSSPSTSVRNFCYLGNGIVLAGLGSPGGLIRSSDYGITWNTVSLPISESFIWSMVTIANGIVLAGTANNGYILRSVDYGLSWSNIGRLGSSVRISSLACLSSGIVLAGTGPSAILYRSTDFGITWSLIGSMFSEDLITSIFFVSNDLVLAGSNPHGLFLRSTDGGLNWTNLGSLYSKTSLTRFVAFDSNYIIGSLSSPSLLVVSKDAGYTWSSLYSNASISDISSLCILPNGSLCAGTFSPQLILHSSIFPNA